MESKVIAMPLVAISMGADEGKYECFFYEPGEGEVVCVANAQEWSECDLSLLQESGHRLRILPWTFGGGDLGVVLPLAFQSDEVKSYLVEIKARIEAKQKKKVAKER